MEDTRRIDPADPRQRLRNAVRYFYDLQKLRIQREAARVALDTMLCRKFKDETAAQARVSHSARIERRLPMTVDEARVVYGAARDERERALGAAVITETNLGVVPDMTALHALTDARDAALSALLDAVREECAAIADSVCAEWPLETDGSRIANVARTTAMDVASRIRARKDGR